MLDHHIQRSIVYRLAFSDGLRFSELKPDVVDNKLFTYHLKKVMSAGLVDKDDSGLYRLTPEGRRLGIRVVEAGLHMAEHAEAVLFLVVRRADDGAWLLYRRRTHPLRARVGFMHAIPEADKSVEDTAMSTLHQQTGLVGRFTALGGGVFRVYEEESLESFTSFSLLYCEDARGELLNHDQYAEYVWEDEPNFSAADMLPNMQALVEAYRAKQPFYLDKTIRI